METGKNCLICNKSNLTVLHCPKEAMHGERFHIVQCKNCHFIFTTPVLSTEELLRFYPQDYYSLNPMRSDLMLSETPVLKKRISRHLKTLLLKEKYGYSFEAKPLFSYFFSILLPFYRYFTTEIYPKNKYGGRVLDVGCGCGEYILHLKQLGWQVYGVESNKKAVMNAKDNYGLDIFCGEIADASFPDNYFDAITMQAVLEHISEPIHALKEVFRILKKNGELIITVPNIWNWERILFGKFWWAWDIPRHLWHFSPVSLKLLLSKAGFREIKICHKSDMYDFPGNIKNMLNNIAPHHSILNILSEQDKLRFVTKYLMAPAGIISALMSVSEQFVVFAGK